jgi:hypothetical protein
MVKEILMKAKKVKTIGWYPNIDEEINKLLNEGWILVHVGESFREREGGDVIYTFIKVE